MDMFTCQPHAIGDDLVADLQRHVQACSGERTDADAAFQQLQRLATIGRLATEVAQEFGNLMTVILGYSELMLTAAEQGQWPEHEQLAELRRAAGRASELTSRLLGYSRHSADDPAPLDLSRLLGNLSPLLVRLLGCTAHLAVRADPAAGMVLADAPSVEQLLINLLLNARDASANNVAVTVTPVRLAAAIPHALGTAAAGDYVRLRVREDGGGLEAGETTRLFRPPITTKANGAGLGLTIVARVARRSNAAVLIESSPGRGTTVDLLFPRLTDGNA